MKTRSIKLLLIVLLAIVVCGISAACGKQIKDDVSVMENAIMRDAAFVYDGESKSLTVEGAPDGAQITYENNGQTEIGSYLVTATVRKDGYITTVLTATLEIRVGLNFLMVTGGSYVYDGEPKSPNVKGIPYGAQVAYYVGDECSETLPAFTDCGTYTVRVEVTLGTEKVEKTANVVITRATISSVWHDVTYTYDGKEKTIDTQSIPSDAKVEYTVNGRAADNVAFIDKGEYVVKMSIISSNYNYFETEFTVKIEYPDFTQAMQDAVEFRDCTEVIVGGKAVTYAAVFPENYTVSYFCNDQPIDGVFSSAIAGVYALKAVVSCTHYNDYEVSATLILYEFSQDKAEFSLQGGVEKANAMQSFALPAYSLVLQTDDGEIDLSDKIKVEGGYGAYRLGEITGNRMTADVFGTLELKYYLNDLLLGVKTVEIGYDGNLVEDVSNWSGSSFSYTGALLYNARVNYTVSFTEKSGTYAFFPFRGKNTDLNYTWGGIASAMRWGLGGGTMYWSSGTGKDNYYSFVSQYATNYQAGCNVIYSYQTVDVFGDDGDLAGVRIYMWVNGAKFTPQAENNANVGYDETAEQYYLFINATEEAWSNSRYNEPCYIRASTNDGVSPFFKVVAVTIGDTMMLDGVVRLEDITAFYGDDYTVAANGLYSGLTATYAYKSGNTVLDQKPTATGEYTVAVTVNGEGYAPYTFTAKLTIKNQKFSGIIAKSATYQYDGTEHEIMIEGNTMGGTLTYYVNGGAGVTQKPVHTEVGEYEYRIELSKEGYDDYEMSAMLIILAIAEGEPWTDEMKSGITTEPLVKVYDGQSVSYAVTVPDGITYQYSYNGNLSDTLSFVEIGEYTFEIIFSKTGYENYIVQSGASILAPQAEYMYATLEETVVNTTVGIDVTLPEALSLIYDNGTYREELSPALLVLSASMGANRLFDGTITEGKLLAAQNTVFGNITVTYRYFGVTVATSTVKVGYDGNLLDDTENWTKGDSTAASGDDIYAIQNYNARINVTFSFDNTVGTMAEYGFIYINYRGSLLCLRVQMYRSQSDTDFSDNANIRPFDSAFFHPVYMYGSSNGWGEAFVYSFHPVDVFDGDGNLSEIRIYTWINGVSKNSTWGSNARIGQDSEGLYYKDAYYIKIAGSDLKEDYKEEFTSPANILMFTKASTGGNAVGLRVGAITVGDVMDMHTIASFADITVTEGESYTPAVSMGSKIASASALSKATIDYLYYADAACTQSIEKPTAAGVYYVKAVISAQGFADEEIVAILTIEPYT